MNIFNKISSELEQVLSGLAADGTVPDGLDISRVTVEPPRDPSHGDMATNAAMVLSKPAGMKPRDLAEAIVAKLVESDLIASAEIAGPGFINLRLDRQAWIGCLASIHAMGTAYGNSEIGGGDAVNVEYVSANPTGPLHIGHARGAVVGDVLAGLLAKAGYNVTKEYYVNDSGAQVDVLARSAYLRYREAHGEAIEIPEGLYPGQYLIPVGQALKAEHGDSLLGQDETSWLPTVKLFAINAMMDLIREDLSELGIQHDVFTSERALVEAGRVEEAFATLENKGLIYTGVLEPPKGKKPEDWEPRPQTLFKSSEFGDDVDRPLKKSDGSWTYFAPDIANHFDKYQRGFKTQIDIFGADHSGYVKRMKAATTAISGGEAELDIKLCQLVRLMDKGEPIKMSKRAGTFVTLRDLIDEVGKDVVRFFLLTRKSDAQLDFDLTLVKEQSRDNPVFYVQYAHARCHSVFRQAKEAFPGESFDAACLENADFSLLTGDHEIDLIKSMAEWPRLIEAAAQAHEPHRVAFYLQDLAATFHAAWHKGSADATLRFVAPGNLELTKARLALVDAARLVIASGFEVFGVEAVTELH
ncbi:arginine--tRNA ligase [Aestuariispira insulae]|uniref:Arginine--tRNA ligase n=1 Tax=Aestuariispira insulae TaxID=1461337 RepID=A0A3D9HNZ5_9PROT|nr:arginine--tRNA ligase [Aestuariispira insulae]RED51031.1 arginyl-tRNA synthetase [Aestuariispira insulae]